MTISLMTQKMLWGRAAGRCSHPECRISLFEDQTLTDNAALIGENCHIVSESDDGPRGNPTMPMDERNSYANLILLCRNHHKIIDAQFGEYTVARLQQMKTDHESWVRDQLGFDAAKQFDDEQYARIVDNWEKLAHLNEWHAWSSHLLASGQPLMRLEVDRDLEELRGYLLNRVWPRRYPELEKTFENFRRVLQDFQNRFHEHAEAFGDDALITKKFYHIREWDEERYQRLSDQYDFHVDLVEDLMLELSRAANLICDRVRQYLVGSYRLHEGRLVAQYGPTGPLTFHDVVVQYSPDERVRDFPYLGLEKFFTDRAGRDLHFGEGVEPPQRSARRMGRVKRNPSFFAAR
jgi:hypothetical protein